MEFKHEPVLLQEVLQWLDPAPGGIFADGTLGGGGHSQRILERIGDTGALYGIDRDQVIAQGSTGAYQPWRPEEDAALKAAWQAGLLPEGVELDGGLLDLGVSSYQLDTPERGFSYHEDAPLDMRMDRSSGMTAAEWLNTVGEKEITAVLYDYGDEKWAARIAKMIVERRPLSTTGDLVACVDAAIPKAVRRKDDGHPARRTFQAVRIAVNDEIAPLEKALDGWMRHIRPGGRLCVITFHSIEDRIVKHAFRRMQNPCTCPPQAPICTCGKKPVAKVMGGGAIRPTKEELAFNPRSHSATLRVAQKL